MENNQNTQTGEQTSTQQNGGNNQQERTFTQDDVNRIVQERLAKERNKNTQSLDLEEREKELNEREFKLNARQKLNELGYPENMLDALNCSSQEAFDKALDTVGSFLKGNTAQTQTEPEKKKPHFTSSFRHRSESGKDPIREAMSLK